MKKLGAFLAILAFFGCNAPQPKKIWNENYQFNNGLLDKIYTFVPRDQYLQSFNWFYQMSFEKTDYLIKNEDIAKAFLLAHNATQIIIIGDAELIVEYANYLKENQVTATIQLQPNKGMKNGVSMIFLNERTGINNKTLEDVTNDYKRLDNMNLEVENGK